MSDYAIIQEQPTIMAPTGIYAILELINTDEFATVGLTVADIKVDLIIEQ